MYAMRAVKLNYNRYFPLSSENTTMHAAMTALLMPQVSK